MFRRLAPSRIRIVDCLLIFMIFCIIGSDYLSDSNMRFDLGFGLRLTTYGLTLLSKWAIPAIATFNQAAVPGQELHCDTYEIPDLFTATIEGVQQGLGCGSFNSVNLVTTYLARIAQVNAILHAVIETNPDAMDIAAEADTLRKSGTLLGPLHGIPILIKDNIATFDKMNNTAGSYALLGATVKEDATMVAKLRQAGAIILGKTNLSQWANFRSSNSTNGWSSRGGQTLGAYTPLQDPSGSSSGSAVSASIGLAVATLGSETDGSIISPAGVNSCVGIKPTVGLTSRYLVIPISSTQDTVGPITRTVKDAAYLLSAIAGKDPNDNYTSAIPYKTIPKYEEYCKEDGLRGLKIGIPRNAWNETPEALLEFAIFNKSLSIFRAGGAVIVDDANFPNLGKKDSTNEMLVMSIEFIEGVAQYFGNLTYNPYNISDLVQLSNFTRSFSLEDYPDRDTGAFDDSLAYDLNRSSPRYLEARQSDLVAGSNDTVLGALNRYGLDALIMPSSQSPGYAAIAGYPVVTVPLGYYPASYSTTINKRGTLATAGPHFPFGISILGRKFSEPTLIQIAYAFEQATQYRDLVKPYILPNMQVKDFLN